MIRKSLFNLSSGIVELSFPMPMTSDDVQDFKDAMAVTFRILERTATNGQRQEGETASEANVPKCTKMYSPPTDTGSVT